MQMAKASEDDMERSLNLVGILGDVEKGNFPRKSDGSYDNDEPEDFDVEDPEHLKAFYDRVMGCTLGIHRVIWGFHTLMHNDFIDPDLDHLAPHPRIVAALELADKQLASQTEMKSAEAPPAATDFTNRGAKLKHLKNRPPRRKIILWFLLVCFLAAALLGWLVTAYRHKAKMQTAVQVAPQPKCKRCHSPEVVLYKTLGEFCRRPGAEEGSIAKAERKRKTLKVRPPDISELQQ
jgi:hypothetical protein